MTNRFQMLTAFLFLILVLVWGSVNVSARGVDDNDAINTLARDVDRLESVRQVKNLQRTYVQYNQYGLWKEMASLFTSDANFIITAPGSGPVESVNVQGQAAIAEWLTSQGGDQQGLEPGALNTRLIEEPLVNLSEDGLSAKARWMCFSLLGDGQGNASFEGGIYENEYARVGKVWKISVSHYYPHFTGPYEIGWTNVNGADLPLIPYHFTLDETGVPIPPAVGPAPHSRQSLDSLEARIDRLNDEDAVRNLQNAYGYYVHRKMWDDVVDLFVRDSAVEVHGVGKFFGRRGVRMAMEQLMGPSPEAGAAGLQHGELNDRLLWDTLVEILPGGNEAYSRGIELGMLGEADKETASWEITVYRNRFVKENGLWKLKELRLYPIMMADYDTGWGSSGVLEHATTSLPAFLSFNPVTHRPVKTRGMKVLGKHWLTGSINPGRQHCAKRSHADRLSEARRKLAKSTAWDATVNVNSAYCYYLDDLQWGNMAGVFAELGNKQSPFAGYYLGKERIRMAATIRYGEGSQAPRRGIAFHYTIQPVVLVADDGRSTSSRTYLFEPHTGKTVSTSSSIFATDLSSGMYPNNQSVLENGIWRLWTLEIDEPYFTSMGYKGGWSRVPDRDPNAPPTPPSPLVELYPPDILMTDLGVRAEHFVGGTGEEIDWPGILPMWFNYRNPVSGRVPEFYWPGAVPKVVLPQSVLTANGYMEPPTGPGPEPN